LISRRSFLKASVAAASGLILPDWLIKAENYIEQEGLPYIERPTVSETILYATDWGGDEYQFALGDPYQEPPKMTWREYLEWNGYSSFAEYYGSDDPEDYPHTDLDDYVDEWAIIDRWVYDGSPSAEAFKYLDSLELGPNFGSGDSVGEIKFYDGVCPGNDSRIVAAPDHLSLSLLQKRLNDPNECVQIKITSS